MELSGDALAPQVIIRQPFHVLVHQSGIVAGVSGAISDLNVHKQYKLFLRLLLARDFRRTSHRAVRYKE